jgi:UrcA family protein
MRFTAIAFVAASLSTGAASAHTPYRAGDDGSVRHVVVRYSELDLTQEEGARVLLGRIHQARAHRVRARARRAQHRRVSTLHSLHHREH